MNESFIVNIKDFFGEAVDATLTLLREDEVVYETVSEDGRVVLSVPDLVDPGVYDMVATRDSGESYRVNSFMIPLATHYFRHSSLHSDLQLTGDNLDPETIIERRKVDPLFYSYVTSLPENAREVFDDIVEGMSHHGLCWGGMVCFSNGGIKVERGEALIGANLIGWKETYLQMPDEGIYSLGISREGITLEQPDIPLATVNVDAEDFARIDLDLAYHTLIRGDEAYYFLEFDETSEDIDIGLASNDFVSGPSYGDGLYGKSSTSLSVTSASLSFDNSGPVFFTNRLYVYADVDYFLLFELNSTLPALNPSFGGGTLLTALPRFKGSNITVDWSRGITFVSSGEEGEDVFKADYLYPESPVVFLSGASPDRRETPLKRMIDDYGLLFDLDSVFLESKTLGARLTFSGNSLNRDAPLFPSTSLYPTVYPD